MNESVMLPIETDAWFRGQKLYLQSTGVKWKDDVNIAYFNQWAKCQVEKFNKLFGIEKICQEG